MINICILTTVHSPFDIRIFHKEARALVKAGYDVTLVAQHDREEIVDGIRIINLQKQSNRIKRLTKTIWEAYRKARQIDAEIYHLHDPELLPIGLLLKIHGKKVIYDMHENVPKQIQDKYWIKPRYRNLMAKLFSMAEKLLLFNVPIIFAENSYRDDYIWIRKYTIVLNMPLIDQLSSFRMNGPTVRDTSIGYIGTVTAERGSLITIDALKILNDRNVKVQFECVGPIDKPHELQLLKLCEEYDLRSVMFHGHKPVHEAWSIIAQCHIGLSLLLPIPNSMKSYPTKMFEYMAMAIPVITSHFPLYQSVVEKELCGICVNPLDAEEVADAISWLMQNPYEAAAMGENGRKAVLEKYNWEIESKKLMIFYEEVLQ
jgi:glycosyltransferase involved in cell wall biosynthesis